MDMELAAECVTQMENLIRGGSRGTGNYLEGCIRQTGGAAGCSPEMQIPDLPMSSAPIRIAYTVTEDSALLQRFAMLEGPIRESRDRFTALCLEVWELVNAGKKKSSQILCEKAMQIIDKGMGIRPCLWWASATAFMWSPNYLSALIKKRPGQASWIC